jgi:serine/threonine protein kinase
MTSTKIGHRNISIPRNIGDYTIKRVIAVGGTSVVVKGRNMLNGERVALKLVNKRQCIEQELNIINRISHPNIIRTHGVLQESDLVVIAMEYCPENLIDWITKIPLISEYAALCSFHYITCALQYLHALGIVHGDIKLDNILVDDNYIPKLADFGYASTEVYKSGDKSGTLIYAAPELFSKGSADMRAADIWSLGIVFYAMITNRFPYPNVDDVHLIHLISHGILDYNVIKNESIRSLLIKMTSLNPAKRPTITEIVNEVEELIPLIAKTTKIRVNSIN